MLNDLFSQACVCIYYFALEISNRQIQQSYVITHVVVDMGQGYFI